MLSNVLLLTIRSLVFSPIYLGSANHVAYTLIKYYIFKAIPDILRVENWRRYTYLIFDINSPLLQHQKHRYFLFLVYGESGVLRVRY